MSEQGEQEVQALIAEVFHVIQKAKDKHGGSPLFYKAILDSVCAGLMLTEAMREASFRAVHDSEAPPSLPSNSDVMYA